MPVGLCGELTTIALVRGVPVGKDYLLVYPLQGDPLEYPLDHYQYSYQYTDNGQG